MYLWYDRTVLGMIDLFCFFIITCRYWQLIICSCPENDRAFDILYCITFMLMDQKWLDMHATYMDFNVRLSSSKWDLLGTSLCQASTILTKSWNSHCRRLLNLRDASSRGSCCSKTFGESRTCHHTGFLPARSWTRSLLTCQHVGQLVKNCEVFHHAKWARFVGENLIKDHEW